METDVVVALIAAFVALIGSGLAYYQALSTQRESNRGQQELSEKTARAQGELELLRFEYSKLLDEYRTRLVAEESKRSRIAAEVVAWSSPLLAAIDGLDRM